MIFNNIYNNHFTTPLLPFEGGAAGAVSRITGTLGKGIAALTLDEDYKRKRREQLARRPETFGAGLAQGGRGLFMVSQYESTTFSICVPL